MTDRELLELAAKAACIQIDRWHGDGGYYWTGRDADDKDRNPGLWIRWNPLRDDGDALRLAVALNMGISIPVFNKHQADVISFRHPLVNAIEEGNDPYAATRRAIVRAAAKIGKETL